jgi:hypothetical protein
MIAVTLLALVQIGAPWPVHSMDRPRPPVVRPPTEGPYTPPPADAIVLFDGSSLSEWRSGNNQPARWTVRDGYVEVVAGTGSLVTARSFGDIQLHLEWATPATPAGQSQERGNSGVFLMGFYEVQILDSYENETYADGQAAALFGQAVPLVNASRPPGAWQAFDIVFRRPRFARDGSVAQAARVTVLHNGVVVHDAVEFTGRTVFGRAATYQPHADKLPVSLQDHGNPMRFRNIWVRELAEP